MARKAAIKFLATTRANLNAQAAANNLLLQEPYYITDENRLAVGTSVSTYQDFAKLSEVGSGGGTLPNPSGARILMLSGRLRLNAV